MKAVLYIHGKDGSAEEAGHYGPLFPGQEIIGFDYRSQTPWEAKKEFTVFTGSLCEEYGSITLIANSVGAFFAMSAGLDAWIRKAYFISPIVDMEKLIMDMMLWAHVTEEELKEKSVIRTGFGEDLSWEYLSYVREHPIRWNAPTEILYGCRDALTARETIASFAHRHDARLTVYDEGEHWFHTDEQMRFLDEWISRSVSSDGQI
ncbi:MAG: alpha/beta hydrolase [Oscillospiraceae bacterium]|nr:alpha/beta hydrolase [Oscillospiraceae bacterium]